MLECLVPQFEAFFREQRHGIGQVRAVHCLAALPEIVFQCVCFAWESMDNIAETPVSAVCQSYDKKFIHSFLPPSKCGDYFRKCCCCAVSVGCDSAAASALSAASSAAAALDAAVSGIFIMMESAAPSVSASILNLLTRPTHRLRPSATCWQNRQCKR